MPRMVRLESPGSLAHIMARGIGGKDLFRDRSDRLEFLDRFAVSLAECSYKCLAWCLMPNHYHLLVRTTELRPEHLMRPLNGGYARFFNKKYDGRGYVFQDRYKSVLCQDQEYAIQLIRYIHLNPIRAGLVRSLDQLATWEWCGHAFLLGRGQAIGSEFQDRTEALRRFSATPSKALYSYMDFMAEGLDCANPENSGCLQETESFELAGAHKGWPAVVGDPEFVRTCMQRHIEEARRKHRQADYCGVLESTAKLVCREYGLNDEELFRRGWRNARSQARAEFCRRAHIEELIPLTVIAKYLGTSLPPIMHLCRRGQALQSPKK